MSARAAMLGFALCVLSGCETNAPSKSADQAQAGSAEVPRSPKYQPSIDDVYPGSSPTFTRAARPPDFEDAELDSAFSSDEIVSAIRIIYQVTAKPYARVSIKAAPAAELSLLVSTDRLRATFVAPGWPKGSDAYVRARSDRAEMYAIDGLGGQVVRARGLAAWFNGGAARRPPSVWVVDAKDDELRAPPQELRMLCEFIAAWSGRRGASSVGGACAQRVFPERFRVGMWHATRVVQVEVRVPMRELRADHVAPPQLPPRVTSMRWMTDLQLARLRRRQNSKLQPAPLRIVNTSSTGMVVTVDRKVVGWMAVGTDFEVLLPAPGQYEVYVVQPLGLFSATPRTVSVPSEVSLPR